MVKAIIRFRLDFADAVAIGPGKIDLLERIGSSGSLSQAGRELGMSYRRAWLLLDNLNTSFKQPVVATSIGGKAGGGATLTEFGAELVTAYRELEKDFNALAAKKLSVLAGVVAPVKKSSNVMRTPLIRSPAPRRVKAKSRGRA